MRNSIFLAIATTIISFHALKSSQVMLAQSDSGLDARNKDGTTALMRAIGNYCFLDFEAAEKLIHAGANLNIQDEHGRTALMHTLEGPAGICGRWTVMKRKETAILLLKAGANPYVRALRRDAIAAQMRVYTLEKDGFCTHDHVIIKYSNDYGNKNFLNMVSKFLEETTREDDHQAYAVGVRLLETLAEVVTHAEERYNAYRFQATCAMNDVSPLPSELVDVITSYAAKEDNDFFSMS